MQTGSNGDTDVIVTDPRTSNAHSVLRDSSGESLAWLSTYLVHRVLTWKDRRQPWIHGYQEMGVDAKSFLPVRLIEADFADQKGPLRSVMLIDNETWLPRTQALLNEVNQVRIPAGFKQVAPPQ